MNFHQSFKTSSFLVAAFSMLVLAGQPSPVAAGGSLTGEHGIGVDKSQYMTAMFTPDDLALMQRVRSVFDPLGLCNPGKVFPTPRLCGEVPGPYRRHPAEDAGLAERM